MYEAIQQELILAAHDISEGGVAVAIAEMSFKNQIGVKIEIPGELSIEKKLFSETGGFILEVARENLSLCKELFLQHQVSFFVIGETVADARLQMCQCIDVSVQDAKHKWENGLREKLL